MRSPHKTRPLPPIYKYYIKIKCLIIFYSLDINFKAKFLNYKKTKGSNRILIFVEVVQMMIIYATNNCKSLYILTISTPLSRRTQVPTRPLHYTINY